MQKLSSMSTDIRVLAMGESGTGKTRLVGTLCKLLPTLVITGDKEGLDTLRQFAIDPMVILLDLDHWDSVPAAIELAKREASKFSAIAVDDFGSLQNSSREYMEHKPVSFYEERAYNSKKAEFLQTVEKELLLGERRFTQQQWGGMWTIMDTFLFDILRMPVPIKLFTTLETPHDTIRDNSQKLSPKLQGDIREGILATASLVIELTKEFDKEAKVVYKASSRPHPKVATKDRFREGGNEWLNPDMANILAYIGEAKKAKGV